MTVSSMSPIVAASRRVCVGVVLACVLGGVSLEAQSVRLPMALASDGVHAAAPQEAEPQEEDSPAAWYERISSAATFARGTRASIRTSGRRETGRGSACA